MTSTHTTNHAELAGILKEIRAKGRTPKQIDATQKIDDSRGEMNDQLMYQLYARQVIGDFIFSPTPLDLNHLAYAMAYEICTYHLCVVICDHINGLCTDTDSQTPIDAQALCDALMIENPMQRAKAFRTVYGEDKGIDFDVARRVDRLLGHHTDFYAVDFGDRWASTYQYAPVGSIVVLSDDPDKSTQIIDELPVPAKLEDSVEYLRVTGLGIFTIKLEPAYDDDPSFSGLYDTSDDTSDDTSTNIFRAIHQLDV